MKISYKKIMFIFLILLGLFMTLSYIIFPMLNSGIGIVEIIGGVLGVFTFLVTFKFVSKQIELIKIQTKQKNETENK